MNTKWEEEFKEISSLWAFDQIEWENAKLFIKDQITKAGKDELRSLMPEIEKMKITHKRFKGLFQEVAHNQALDEVIKLIQSRSEGKNL